MKTSDYAPYALPVSALTAFARLTSNQSCTRSPKKSVSTFSPQFWSSSLLWKRAGVNTLRCLVGCTLGDFSMMWFLQSQHPGLGIYTIMGLSMASGIASSMSLETLLLRYGIDRLGWRAAVTTAAGMSLVSMLSMEAVENIVDYHLMAGVVDFSDPKFWAAAAVSSCAGFLAPLPYNYIRLRKYGRACH
ncbi:hypothetical protein N431DRAFT_441097 [Stipitochalara longipes BDJ]|nr:hypothetical protein N431DRAFT_441097 [Stipitochalara longipes BDJ]